MEVFYGGVMDQLYELINNNGVAILVGFYAFCAFVDVLPKADEWEFRTNNRRLIYRTFRQWALVLVGQLRSAVKRQGAK